ncbi:hypothetical protein SAMN05661091_0853 [Paenibacillus uliginis N3/975]|uniref:Uncharacterized protein n=1 Tax=Paenibacillus uliginis N3/975 TaxID=1313296 RepID=A0A1X7GPL4_9BACL|nr:hypothetical protein SAMN05661091_0853 [Paenibacillus uliginis N3/975]
MLYHLWVRHHLRPGDFWCLPRGERLLLLAFSEMEMDSIAGQN